MKQRTSIGHTPNILFIHLNRIGLNYDTFMNEKFNNKIEFPHLLNLHDYSIKNIAEKENKIEKWLEDSELSSMLK